MGSTSVEPLPPAKSPETLEERAQEKEREGNLVRAAILLRQAGDDGTPLLADLSRLLVRVLELPGKSVRAWKRRLPVPFAASFFGWRMSGRF